MKQEFQYSETHYGAAPCRPDVHGVLIKGKRGRLLSVLYTAAGEGTHPTVLLLHGIPGCEKNYDLAQDLRRAGFHVLSFHYSGSWGSDGDYSLAHDLEDANTALDFILNDEKFGFDKDRIYAVGHSLGGFVCGQLSASRPEIRKAVLITPCDIGRLPVIREQAPDYYRAVCEVLEESADWLTGTSGEKLRREAEEHSETLRLESAAAGLAAKPVLCISASLDVYTPPELNGGPLKRAVEAQGGTAFQHVVWPTDHFLSDYRLTLAEIVLRFLQK